MYCNHCGKLNLDGANFCTQCGQSLMIAAPPPVNPVPTPVTDQPIKQTPSSGFMSKLKPDYGFFAIALVLMIIHTVWNYWRDHSDKDIRSQESLYKTVYIISTTALIVQFLLAVLFTRNLILRILIALIGIWVCYNAIQLMQESFHDLFDKKRFGDD